MVLMEFFECINDLGFIKNNWLFEPLIVGFALMLIWSCAVVNRSIILGCTAWSSPKHSCIEPTPCNSTPKYFQNYQAITFIKVNP